MPYSVFITLEPYLAQWLIHECGGETPIRMKRGSAEADILELWLSKPPKDPEWSPQLTPLPGQVEVILPYFNNKNIRYNYYLSPRGEVCLHACIKNRFRVQLWKDLYTIGNVTKRNDIAISEWMEAHGIEVNDTNWNTIAKILQRKRAIYYPDRRLTDHKSSKHRKNKKNEEKNQPV